MGWSMSVSETITLSKDEADEFNKWVDGFYDRAGYDAQKGRKNLTAAMRRKYGYPDYHISGSNNTYTLSLGDSL